MNSIRININNYYDYGMDGDDIADQIRGSYCFDHLLRNYKWWHSIFWWGFQVLMVNAYKFHCRYLEDINEEPMSHYMFQNIITQTWMEKDYLKTIQREDQTLKKSSLSSMSTTATPNTPRRSRIYDSALNPITGTLKWIMNRSLGHWTLVPSIHHIKKSNFQLHYWDTGKRKYIIVGFCKDCNVSLCTDNWFEVFHTT